MPIGELAKRLNISRTALSNQMNGNPTILTLERIATVLECTVFELIDPDKGFFHVYDDKGNYRGLLKQ